MGRGSTGNPHDKVYELRSRAIAASRLTVRVDPKAPARHAFLEPASEVMLETYEQALGDTRTDWSSVWP
jgi:hypothetical protein